jgi:hypothetical protein
VTRRGPLWQDARVSQPTRTGVDALEAALDWTRPSLHGIGWLELTSDGMTGAVTFTSVNKHSAHLAAAAVATVVDYRGGSGSYPLSRDELGEVVELLAQYAPDGPDRHNLDVWREMAEADDDPDAEAIYVFVGDPTRRSGDPYVTELIALDATGRPDAVYGEPIWWPAPDDDGLLIDRWSQTWPESMPIAHELKDQFDDFWVRFHSLPAAKRYADSDAEYAELLLRHNAVLDDLASGPAGGEEILVIVADVAPAVDPVSGSDVEDMMPDAEFWVSVPWHYADPELLFAHLYLERRPWRPGVLDDLLRAVADAELGGVLIAPADLRWLYHPYDGGADVILPSGAERDALAARHAAWRSPHPSGL